ncbi:hypothetical protein DNTS_022143 [Danionella cerebrum]|uniref:Zinc phosphodiesterase ELAC protein 2 n=1 Tax=Danionella cerebrum TaxID=2873325 RepID=A0A553R0N9_9TELE|nr:hypothetical protein DNTS_022143 [Danionella translucida]
MLTRLRGALSPFRIALMETGQACKPSNVGLRRKCWVPKGQPFAAEMYLQVLGSGSRDSGAALMLHADGNRYLFNCGEGTQRLMTEQRLKLSQTRNIFLTRMCWETVGGLTGMFLSLKEIESTGCVVSGPLELEHLLQGIFSLAGQLPELEIEIQPYTDPLYKDEYVSVTQVPLFSESKAKSPSPSPVSEPSSQQQMLRRSPNIQKTNRDPSLVVAYVCQATPKLGNFQVAKAKAMGLPVGTPDIKPFIVDLKEGKSVMFNGREIPREELCTPDIPGPAFLVIDCPSEDFIKPLCTNHTLKSHQTDGSKEAPALVVHMTPESVLTSQEYQSWMKRFPSSTEHLVMNEHSCGPLMTKSHKLQTQLHFIHPKIFPKIQPYKEEGTPAPLDVPCIRAEYSLQYRLRPTIKWQRNPIPDSDPEEFIKDVAEVPNLLQELEECRKFESSEPVSTATDRKRGALEMVPRGGEAPDELLLTDLLYRQFPEVVFLGTGSAKPASRRNVSGILVSISPSQSLLLDCGEGTFGQLCRHYGNDTDEMLCKLSTIFVSHLHADHHMGLIQLLVQRGRALTRLKKKHSPVFLVAPSPIMTWLNRYHMQCEEVTHHISFIPAIKLCHGSKKYAADSDLIQKLLKKNQLSKFQTCLARHCASSFCCSIDHVSGWKLVYSGDTMPCEGLVSIATLGDGMEHEATLKKHSTMSQAINIGRKMNAQYTVLTHFSSRYSKIPPFYQSDNNKVVFAFDHMRVRRVPRFFQINKCTVFNPQMHKVTVLLENVTASNSYYITILISHTISLAQICLKDFKILNLLLRPMRTFFAAVIEEMEERRLRMDRRRVSRSFAEELQSSPNAKRKREEMELRNAAKQLKAN